MPTEFITPIQLVGSINEPNKTPKVSGAESNSVFKDVFQNAVNNVKDSQANLETQQYLLSTGQIDDAHTVPVAAAEAQLSIDMLVQLRNKAVESYNELMRISL